MRKEIEKTYNVDWIKQTCSCCPSQWEGKLDDGRMFYARFRWGVLNVSLSKQPTDDVMDCIGEEGEYIIGMDIGDNSLDGYLEETELMKILEQNNFIFK